MAEVYVAPSVEGALELLLTGGKGSPKTLAAAYRVYGESPRTQNPAIARDLLGLAPGRLPAPGTLERRRYQSLIRAVQRQRAEPGKQRRAGKQLARLLIPRARALLAAPYIRRARREGVLMRLVASIRVSRTWKYSTMPADAGQGQRFAHVPGHRMRPVLEAWERQLEEVAGVLMLAEFFRSYWGTPDPADVGEIVTCSLRWP